MKTQAAGKLKAEEHGTDNMVAYCATCFQKARTRCHQCADFDEAILIKNKEIAALKKQLASHSRLVQWQEEVVKAVDKMKKNHIQTKFSACYRCEELDDVHIRKPKDETEGK